MNLSDILDNIYKAGCFILDCIYIYYAVYRPYVDKKNNEKKLYNFYIDKEKVLDTKNKILIIIYLLLTLLSNEILFFSTTAIICLLFVEQFFRNKTKIPSTNKNFNIILLSIIFIIGILYLSPINSITTTTYNFHLNIPTINQVKTFFKLYYKLIFTDNLYWLIPSIMGFIILLYNKNVKVIKTVSYTIISYLEFYFSLLFVNQNCVVGYYILVFSYNLDLYL